jgi:hypothetical protein
MQRSMFYLGMALFVLVGSFALPQGLNFLASGLSDWQRNFRLFKFSLFFSTFIALESGLSVSTNEAGSSFRATRKALAVQNSSPFKFLCFNLLR